MIARKTNAPYVTNGQITWDVPQVKSATLELYPCRFQDEVDTQEFPGYGRVTIEVHRSIPHTVRLGMDNAYCYLRAQVDPRRTKDFSPPCLLDVKLEFAPGLEGSRIHAAILAEHKVRQAQIALVETFSTSRFRALPGVRCFDNPGTFTSFVFKYVEQAIVTNLGARFHYITQINVPSLSPTYFVNADKDGGEEKGLISFDRAYSTQQEAFLAAEKASLKGWAVTVTRNNRI